MTLMRFLRQLFLGLMLFSASLALLGYAGALLKGAFEARNAEPARPKANRERQFAVNVIIAKPQKIAPVLDVFGEVQSQRILDIRSATSGVITELGPNVVEGGQVVQGDLLVSLDPAELASNIARIETDLSDSETEIRDAEAALALAQDELIAGQAQLGLREKAFARQQDLSARGLGSAAQVEAAEIAIAAAGQSLLGRRQAVIQARTRLAQSQTRLARSKLSLKDAERKLADTQINAEFSGALTNVSVVSGGIITANERIAQLIDPSQLEVAFRVSTAQYARLVDPSGRLQRFEMTASLGGLGETLQASGKISRESASVGEGQTGRLVFATLDAAAGLKPGDFVTVTIQEPSLNYVIPLPATALGPDGTVLRVDEDSRLDPVPVTLVRRQKDQILVRSRELADEQVVSERTPLLGKGIKVKTLSSDAKPEPEKMVRLLPEQRAKLIAVVQGNKRIPKEAKARLLSKLNADEVPARMVERLEGQTGG